VSDDSSQSVESGFTNRKFMKNSISVAILGVSGRMGHALLSAMEEADDLRLSGALSSSTSRWVNQDAGALAGPTAAGVIITSDPMTAIRGAQVAVGFTLPQGTPAIVSACESARCPLVLGTTGHSAEQLELIKSAAKKTPIVMAANFSLGVNLLLKLTELSAKTLDDNYDIEVFEAHHRNKKDAPSGTALAIGSAAAKGRGTTLQTAGVYVRHGETGARARGAIGFSVLRGGDIIGDHTLTFAGPGERIELAHKAHDRVGFARGALKAARWVIGKQPGLYSMQDVLGFR
jgi:4-hydroxy-tetrahydrodipicolinate reductase